ncbi:DUF4338 domain-containing protein [Paenibacillus sp. BR2-3]|uniref:hypothetical protein n=1 Tax=Paenibacillus sp. BR2-3 TaxID=3048494 RepID=UPI003977627D
MRKQNCYLDGKYKKEACLSLLEKLEARGEIVLPAKRPPQVNRRPDHHFVESDVLEERAEQCGNVSKYAPIAIESVQGREGIRLWNSFIERYHILGYKRPFGAHQRL